ncbi:hypothetical protein KA005_85070 [bacterium]|nr:hypothetical protein [bacterium]
MRFHIGDVLSVTTDRLLSPSGISGVRDLLNFMTARDLTTLELPAAIKVMAPHLPEYDVEVPELHGIEDVNRWLADQINSGNLPEFVEVTFWQPNGKWKLEMAKEMRKIYSLISESGGTYVVVMIGEQGGKEGEFS